MPKGRLAARTGAAGTALSYTLFVMSDPARVDTTSRLCVNVRGAVQGVGMRPFVYRLATDLHLEGFVMNTGQGVVIEVQGAASSREAFMQRLVAQLPAAAFIQSMESTVLDPVPVTGFAIRDSEVSGERTALVMPDLATCPDCLAELRNPVDRRYRYPFVNCTNCGPRYSIILSMPYDRSSTTMSGFRMCDRCRAEYEDPTDRRFHAQPVACPACGPRLELLDCLGAVLAHRDEALGLACDALRRGLVVAVKGLGGFQLLVDATNPQAVNRLRERKRREHKPFAVMAPSLDWVRENCALEEAEEALLRSAASPIVLVRRAGGSDAVVSSVAPGNPYLGVMIPYTPLHHLLLDELGFAVVATSGNLSQEPICTQTREALARLSGLADLFLVHDRPIARHVDDSIVRVVLGRELVLRRARGYAPLPVPVPGNAPAVLAVGAHMKNAVAVAVGPNAFIGQHVGDLESEESLLAFSGCVGSLTLLFDARPEVVACDAHPDYLSSRHARGMGLAVIEVQHHHAHVLSCMAENGITGPVLGVAFDGTGWGPDGTIWGGEFLVVDGGGYRRVGRLRPFRLPGGEAAVREPRRSALALLVELHGDAPGGFHDEPDPDAFSKTEQADLLRMIRRGVNSPVTSSAGRLFDGVASLVGLARRCSFEGQAAMELEHCVRADVLGSVYEAPLVRDTRIPGLVMVDWGPMVSAIAMDVASDVDRAAISRGFHEALARAVVRMARACGLDRVVLSGGCFQNATLTRLCVELIAQEGLRPYWHQRVPPNDGGIALGQLVAARLGG